MTSREIRKKFLDFFVRNGHEKVASSSLIPAEDPTLLFTNAGMNQFKDLFLGTEKRGYTRATSVQKCVRAGGKHNDLDNVGFTKRHLTFFEMMGNFSFGDYFKKEAIRFAWDFLTKEINLDAKTLYASVFETDDEAYTIWLNEIGLPKEKIYRLSAEHNFWQMGDLGPCGPCTEIYIDRGAQYGHKNIAECGPGCDCDRFLEIWNLVFMQFDRQLDGSLQPLKQTGVDTGMGLERLCAVVQHQDSVFMTDIFVPLISEIEKLTKREYKKQDDVTKAAFHVLADHIRSSSFIIADGCAPSNEGRGYVLRKIIRRAALFAQKLTENNIFPELSRTVVDTMGDIYPELVSNKELIYAILTSEIEKFSANLIRGETILNRYFEESEKTKIITGQQAFKLYDTYGFPLEAITAAAREKGYIVDQEAFDQEMHKQQTQSGKKTTDQLSHLQLSQATEFTGYHELETKSVITAIVLNDTSVQTLPAGETGYIITAQSPFFIVGGGQVPDQGWLICGNIKIPLQEVRFIGNAIAAKITAPTTMSVGDTITSSVDPIWRTNAMKNHTATHLLQAALIELFGKQIQQSGSLVHPDYLRFDFTYHQQLTTEDIKKIENIVNEKIRQDIPIHITYCTLKEAQSHNALAFFGEKYRPEKVRMVQINHFSTELCGGTHVQTTGAIGTFKITESAALAAGHRRIVAVTGPRAIELFQETFTVIKQLSQDFKIKREEVLDAVYKQKEQLQKLQQEIKKLDNQLLETHISTWLQAIETINTIPFLFLFIPAASTEKLRTIAHLLEHQKAAFYFVISTTEKQTIFYALISPTLVPKINLKTFSLWLKEEYNFRSGGQENSLQGSGEKYPSDLKDTLIQWLKRQ